MSSPSTLVSSWVDDGVVPGVALAIARHGELAAEAYAGKTAAGAGAPVTPETLYSIASISKVFTATLAMRLVEQGEIALDESVRRTLPAFTGSGKRDLSLLDLLTHTSGMPKDDPRELELWEREAGFRELAESAAALPLGHRPGSRVAYSNAGYWVLGAALEAATGASFIELMRELVLAPAGLTDTFIDPPVSEYPRIARRYGRAKIMNAPYGRRLGSPSSGIFATARDLVRFASFFLHGGTLDGTRLLSRAAVELMTSSQTGKLAGGIEGTQIWPHSPWGIGWEITGDKRPHWTGELTSPRTICHIGQGGTLLWADPDTGVACAVLANRDIATGWATDPARWALLSNAVVATAKR